MTYRYEPPKWEPRPHNEIVDAWMANFIKGNEPFKNAKYPGPVNLKVSYQMAFMALLMAWELVKAVRNIAHDSASRIGYEMLGE